ncbi:MAG: stress response translation initiation inhibitor YciH [Oleiphilus sp.]|nr:MAG: stress response translation initiation inhibitor YciH [Oleiphilus sp.]
MPPKRTLVYSTEYGRLCPECESPIDQCQCKQESIPAGDGIVRISRETKGRKGKGVTLVNGLLLAPAEMKTLAKELKKKCGVGGAVKNGTIEIQGDYREHIRDLLQAKGYTVKLAGG